MKSRLAFAATSILLTACGNSKQAPAAHPSSPASVENKVAESDLTRITLSEKAEKRLGIAVAGVTPAGTGSETWIIGDLVPIPGRSIIVSAPTSGAVSKFRTALTPGMEIKAGQELFHLTPQVAPQRDLRLTLEADVESTKARLDNATLQANRARQLLGDMAGSKRNVDIAEQELGQAKAAYEAALARLRRVQTAPLDADVDMPVVAPSNGILRQLQIAQGQVVNAGAPLLEIADFSRVWLRVPVYVGQLKEIKDSPFVQVRDADGEGIERQGRRVEAPPTADPFAATADVYYEIDNPRSALRPGQRMLAILPTRGAVSQALSIPRSAVVYDVHGDAWVYVAEGGHKFRRQRVEVLRATGSTTLISRGLTESTKVVSVGAAELFGTEFGAGH